MPSVELQIKNRLSNCTIPHASKDEQNPLIFFLYEYEKFFLTFKSRHIPKKHALQKNLHIQIDHC